MVADGKLLLDQLGHAAPSPDVTKKAMGLRTLSQQINQLHKLVWVQGGWATWRRVISECRWAVAAGARQPLTNSSLADAQSRGDLDLGPTLLMKLPGALAATCAPTDGPVAIWCAHKPQHSTFWPKSIRSLCSYV